MISRCDHSFVVWFTGQQGAGKSTLARLLEKELLERGFRVEVLDWDSIRPFLIDGNASSKKNKIKSTRRIGFLCQLLCRNGIVAIAVDVAAYRKIRHEVRDRCQGGYVEIYAKCGTAKLLERHLTRAYDRALRGDLPLFFGWTHDYEEPLDPDLVLETDRESPQESLAKVLGLLEDRRFI